MPGIKPARRSINSLPARRPSAGVMIERCCVESQSGYDSERVTFARVNGDPSPRAAFAIAAELGRADRRSEHPSRTENIRDRAGTIVSVIIKRFVAATVTIRF
jgi:hypothetical protein